MNIQTCVASGMVGATGVAVAVMLTSAGPLSPPGGPVAPTYKTLAEVEPRIAVSPINTPGDADSLFKITYPGSYYLTGNIAGVSGKHGVEIAVSDVVLDLNGFELIGVGVGSAAPGDFSGVHVSVDGTRRIVVRNGRVSNWTGSGLDLRLASSASVRDVLAEANDVNGIHVGDESVVDRCGAFDNRNDGVVAGASSVVSNTIATGQIANGSGIQAGAGSRVVACVASGNLGGLGAGDGSHVLYSRVDNNGGVDFMTFNVLGGGIGAGRGSVVRGCTAFGNGNSGIGSSGVVEYCHVSGTTGYNILATSRSTVRSNLSSGASEDPFLKFKGFGVFAVQDARVEGNHLIENVRGVYSEGVGNLVIRNTAWNVATNEFGFNANYSLAAGNKVGTTIIPPESLAVLGLSGGAGVGTIDPFANFSF